MIKTQTKNKKVQFDEVTIKEMEEADFQACSAINDKWNAAIAKQREIRVTKMREQRKEDILETLVNYEKKQMRLQEKIDEHIRKAKKEAPTFITAENVDAAIKKCLENITDYNRALDLEGNWHVGKYPPISLTEETQNSTVAEQ